MSGIIPKTACCTVAGKSDHVAQRALPRYSARQQSRTCPSRQNALMKQNVNNATTISKALLITTKYLCSLIFICMYHGDPMAQTFVSYNRRSIFASPFFNSFCNQTQDQSANYRQQRWQTVALVIIPRQHSTSHNLRGNPAKANGINNFRGTSKLTTCPILFPKTGRFFFPTRKHIHQRHRSDN